MSASRDAKGRKHPLADVTGSLEHYCPDVSRLPYLRHDELDPDGQKVWDSIVRTRGEQFVNEQGGLVGPFNAFVHAPDVGGRLASLGAALRFGTSIGRRLTEVAIITVGARWKAEFEWWAHAQMAREHWVPDAVVDAIGRGEDPPFVADDERAVYVVACQLTQTGQLGQDAYDAARQFLGDTGMVELVSLRVLHPRIVPTERLCCASSVRCPADVGELCSRCRVTWLRLYRFKTP